MARLLYFATYQHLLYEELRGVADETLAGVAGKAVKEVAYHVDHATQWVLRLGDGTEESHRRMQAGLDGSGRTPAEMFESDDLVRRLPVAVDPSTLHDEWTRRVTRSDRRVHLQPAGVVVPAHVVVVRGGTPSTWATCSPSCSTWPAPTRGRHGDATTRPIPLRRRVGEVRGP